MHLSLGPGENRVTCADGVHGRSPSIQPHSKSRAVSSCQSSCAQQVQADRWQNCNAVFLHLGCDWVALVVKQHRLSPRAQLPFQHSPRLVPSLQAPISPERSFPSAVHSRCTSSSTTSRVKRCPSLLCEPRLIILRQGRSVLPLVTLHPSLCIFSFLVLLYSHKLLHQRQWTTPCLTSRMPLPEPNLPTTNPSKAPLLPRKSSRA
jgi:hypothetical protein